MIEPTCGCEPDDVSTETVAKTVETHIDNLDPQRADAFERLLRVRAARGAGYAREQERLARKYGADHPRVAALATKIRFNDGLRRDLGFEVTRAKTETPTVDKTGYVFHGFVRDRAGDGVSRLTIALYDENRNLIRELGYGCTDERGYFLMRYERARTEPVEAPVFERRAAGEAKLVARIYVLDSKKATLQIDKQPLYPKLGEVDFRIIILGAEAAPCTPPPPEAGEPAPPPAPTSTPLENIRGIGPAKARKLRAAGIKDVETLLKTDTAKLVEIAGFDAKVKREAAAALKRAKKK
jgi:Helix-hairpin-helix domain